MVNSELKSFYKDKSVFVTGHTGFKGAWLTNILSFMGARVTGFALPPEDGSLYNLTGISERINSVYGDIRSFEELKKAFDEAEPEVVFHLAAQPIVLTSYEQPLYTYETNVMGTVNLLECVRKSSCVKSFLNVTTDKVYENNDAGNAFREDDKLDGFDPYSNSKSCSELVTHSYGKSFLKNSGIAVSTARAGNVIGGGDIARDRIIPDCIRAASAGEPINIRNPYSVRPFQHVLEPLYVYMMLAARQYDDITLSGSYNVGPQEEDCVTTGTLADAFCKCWGEGASWHTACTDGPHEASFLRLDCTKLKSTFGWKPRTDINDAASLTVDYCKRLLAGENACEIIKSQTEAFERR